MRVSPQRYPGDQDYRTAGALDAALEIPLLEGSMSGCPAIPALGSTFPELCVSEDGLPALLVADGKIMENEVATAKRKMKRVLSKPAKHFTLGMAGSHTHA